MKRRLKLLLLIVASIVTFASISLLTACDNEPDEPVNPYNPEDDYKDFSDFYGYWINSDKTGAMNFVKYSNYQCKVFYYTATKSFSQGYAEWESLYGGDTFTVLAPDNGFGSCYAVDVKISTHSYNRIVLKNAGSGHTLSSYIFSRVSEEDFFKYLGSGGNSSSGDNSGSSNQSEQSKELSTLLNHKTWSWYKSQYDNGHFTFYDANKIQFVNAGKAKLGSYGIPTLDARGTFSLNGNILTATFTSVSVDPSTTNMSQHFPGWEIGKSKTVKYTIKSISNTGLIITDSSTTWNLSPLY